MINALGRTFMHPCRFALDGCEKEVKKLKKITPNILIDFHAEATAEKVCFARFCADLGVTAFIGTHTHVQTAMKKSLKIWLILQTSDFAAYRTALSGWKTRLPSKDFLQAYLSDTIFKIKRCYNQCG